MTGSHKNALKTLVGSALRLNRAPAQRKFRQALVLSIFWIETVLAALAAIVAALTPLYPHWIEWIFGIDPDHLSGSLERNIVMACVASAAAFAILARRTWHRAPAA